MNLQIKPPAEQWPAKGVDKFSVNNQALQPTSCTQTHVIRLVQLSQHRKEALNIE
jgi:hypothetical protein